MADGGYKIRNKKEVHFITFAVVVPITIGRVDARLTGRAGIYKKRISGYRRRKFEILSEGKRIVVAWVVHNEQSCSFDCFSKE
jgi:hypothetical protein